MLEPGATSARGGQGTRAAQQHGQSDEESAVYVTKSTGEKFWKPWFKQAPLQGT